MVKHICNIVMMAVLAMGIVGPASAQDAPVLIVVTDGTETAFGQVDLENMTQTRFSTTTIWTEGTQEFVGVSLYDLVAELALEGDMLQAYAINDYSVEVPFDDAVEGGPIVAYLNNGEPMSVRDKGPLWLVYPYDTNPVYQSEVIYSRSIWQLTRLEVKD